MAEKTFFNVLKDIKINVLKYICGIDREYSSSHQEEWPNSQALSTFPRPVQDYPSWTQDLELQARTTAKSGLHLDPP